FNSREKAALRYTEAILWDPQQADDALWRQLHEEFTEPEIVEIGYWAGFTSGGQRWLHTLHTKQGELAAYMESREPAKRTA
ncbi:MAG: hypothetical protein OXI74_19240, partial [Rhodospirillaceae bacterium]|nr:hypothetical protein [Rhodospirillaceae bacterium]